MKTLTKKQRQVIYKKMLYQNQTWLTNRYPLTFSGLGSNENKKINRLKLIELGLFCDLSNSEGFGLLYSGALSGYDGNAVLDTILLLCIEMTKTK